MSKFDVQIQCEELEEINQGGAQALPERESMKAILYNVENGFLSEVNISDYKDIQRVLAFQDEAPVRFEAVYWEVGKVPVTVYVDDEGLLKDQKRLLSYIHTLCDSVHWDYEKESSMLVGNLLFTMADDDGEMIDLDIDIKEIAKRIYPYATEKNLFGSGNLKVMEIL